MQSTLLYQTLSSVSEKEWNQISKASISAFFNHRSEVTSLISLLKRHFTSGQPLLADSTIYYQVFNQKTFNAARWRLLISDALQVVESALAVSQFLSEEESTLHLLQWYRKKGIDKNFNTHYNRLAKSLNKAQSAVDILEFEHLQQFEKYQHDVEIRRTGNLNIQALMDTADLAYIGRKMRLLCYARAHQQVVQLEYDTELVDAVLNYIKSRELWNVPVIGAYYFAYGALTYEGEESCQQYERLRGLILDHTDEFELRELRGIFILAINFCILQHRRGQASFTEDVFLLYKKGIEKGPLTLDNVISPYTYRNAVAVGIILDELEWATSFTEDYKTYLDKAQRESIYNFNMARICYQKQDYEGVREYLWNTDFDDILLSLSAKTILLKVYYLLKEYLVLDSAIESFRAYLKRKKIAAAHASNYFKIMSYMRQLRRVSSFQKKPERVAALKAKLDKETSFTEMQWFKEQIQLLEAMV